MSDLPSMNLDFSKAATVWKFIHDKSFVRGIMGPVGSGKSFGCAAEIMLKAVQQKPSPRDGIRYSRFVIVRNTYPELEQQRLRPGKSYSQRMYGVICAGNRLSRTI